MMMQEGVKIVKKKLFSVLLSIACVLSAGGAVLTEALPVMAQEAADEDGERKAPQLDGLKYEKKMDFTYVECIGIYYYEGGYKFFDVYDSGQYLLIPEGGEIPSNLDKKVTVIQAPAQNIYMAATATMALVNAIGGLDCVGFSSLKASDWYVQDAQDAMNAGDIVFAGKYSEPDYELLLSGGCDLAVESTMILHTPKVQEMIENMGIPVFIDRSSYESHPLARSEWAKVYGALLNREEEAEHFFAQQNQVMEDLEDFENTGKTVAFFSVNSDGSVVVRRQEDSVPKMIELAGGRYVLNGVSVIQESKRSSVTMTMEEFYADAIDADYLVYNSTIQAPIGSINDLLAKSPLFGDFKAVKEGNVWCADKYLYQATDIVGQLIRDFNHMLTDGDASQMTFLKKID